MPVGRTRKSKFQTNFSSSPQATTTVSDEEENTSSSVYSTLESPVEKMNLYSQKNIVSNQPTSTDNMNSNTSKFEQ